MGRNSNENSLKEVIEQWLKSAQRQDRYQEARLINLWEEIMGPGISTHTKKITFKNGTLSVVLDSSVLRDELSRGKTKMIDLLNKKMGQELVQEIRLK